MRGRLKREKCRECEELGRWRRFGEEMKNMTEEYGTEEIEEIKEVEEIEAIQQRGRTE